MCHRAKEFVVKAATRETVTISFIDGHTYDICRDGRIYDHNYRERGQRVLVRQSTIRRGYKQVSVRADSQTVDIKVHRLVAMCFLSNPDNLPSVNHKDENPANNHADNLEWCTQKYNTNYSIEKLKHSKKYMNAKLTKDKVKAMLRKDTLVVFCDTASELESAYQTAIQAKKEMKDSGREVAVSKSGVTLSVILRTGI